MTKYPSKYSNGKTVSAAQFITELICENKAKIDKLDLHYRFWTTPHWSKFYRNQISTANKLVKEYDPRAIIAALKSPECASTYSLRSPVLIKHVRKEAEKITKQNETFSLDVDRQNNKSYRKNSIKKNIISKLEELDNEH